MENNNGGHQMDNDSGGLHTEDDIYATVDFGQRMTVVGIRWITIVVVFTRRTTFMCFRRSTTMVSFRQRTTVVGFGRKNNSGRYLTVVSRRNRLFTHPAQRRLSVEGHLGEAPIRVVLWCIRGGHP